MIGPMTRFSLLALLTLALGACAATAQEPAPGDTPSPKTSGGGQPAATFGNRAISLEEIDARWRSVNPADHFQAAQALYDGRRAALDGIIADALLEATAAARGVTPTELLAEEIAARVRSVSDAEVAAFFNSNRNLMQGRPLEVMQSGIRNFLQDQQAADARQTFVDELRASGPLVAVLLDAPRQEIALSEFDPAIGSLDAPVTLVEFSDFECPFCAEAAPTLKRLLDAYGDRIRMVWKDFPLTQIHPNAYRAAEAAHCASAQDGFWAFHDVLFANQQSLDDASLKAHAAGLGLDTVAFDVCLDASYYGDRVRAGMDMGTRLGVNSTPTVFINGRALSGAQPYDVFAAVIDEELARASQ
jgi:protein-disulfide isomerase